MLFGALVGPSKCKWDDALGHGEQLKVHLGEPPNANRLVVHEFPSLEAVEAWVEDVKANREQLHTLGDLTIISVPAI